MIRAADALTAIATLPLKPASTAWSDGPMLILAPHPDDESLGCGGLIAAACAARNPPFVLVLTDGTGSHPNSRSHPPARLRRVREAEARAAVAALGLQPERIGFLGLRDTQSPVAGPAFDAAVTAVASLALRLDARTVLAPWMHDPHCDHESAHLIAVAAAREANLRHVAYPVWGLTLPDDTPLHGPCPTGCRIDIAAHLPAKRLAIAAHRTQLGGVIIDDPRAFQLPPALLSAFDRPFETLLDVPTMPP